MNFRKITAAVLAVTIIAGAASGLGDAPVISAMISTEDTIVSDGTYESMTYWVYSDHVEIAACTDFTSASIEVPAEIEGLPVTALNQSAFALCGFETITLPDTLTTIGKGAFSGCKKLVSMTIPANVSEIGEKAFQGCDALEEINVDFGNISYSSLDGVLFTEDMETLIKFPNNSYMTSYTIPNTIKSVASGAFLNTQKLTSLFIPASVKYIDPFDLSYSYKLEQIYVLEGNEAYVSEDGVLFNKDKTELLLFPQDKEADSFIVPDTVAAIGDNAFLNSKITMVTIPSSVTSIGSEAFGYCPYLETVSFSEGLTEIGVSAFIYCTKLKSAELPSTVESIGASAFDSCSSLSEVTLPEGLTTIENGAFDRCDALVEIRLPESLTTLGAEAFSNCSSLISINIPESITTLESRLFSYCTSLAEFTVPEHVARLEEGVFNNCGSLLQLTFENPDCVIYRVDDTIPDNTFIYGYSGSSAQAYAEEFSRNFIALDIMKGDVNKDDIITATDAANILAAYASQQTSDDSGLNKSEFAAADVNSDGTITAVDAALTLSYYAYSSTTPVEELISFEEFLAQQ